MSPHTFKIVRLFLAFCLLTVGVASLSTSAYAANPVVSRFIADPAAYYFNGKVYMYNTDDQVNSGSTWDSKSWRAYSSTDLVNWTDEGAFWKVGSGGFTWASNWAWAPSAAYKNGYYYMYLPVDANTNGSGIAKIGVIRCTAPTSGCVDPIGGPLIQEGREANTGSEPIDPQIFVDDDGTPYLFFGGMGGLKRVRLNSDMISLNGSITNVTATGFKESAWIHKYNGLYYLSYSTGWPGPIQYSTSTSITGSWTFRGTILPSQNINTNHQSPLFYNNRWFLFYQKGSVSGWSNYRRNVSIDCLYYNTDNTLKQVVTTSGGVNSNSCGSGPTATPTRTNTPGGPTATPTRTPTPGGAFPVPGTYYRLINRNSGKVADVASCSTANSAEIRQWTSLGNTCQQWSFVATGSYWKIVNRNSGKLADVSGGSTADGGNILQYTDNGGTNQHWTVTSVGSGYYRLINRNSGKDWDVADCGTADGADIRQWTWLNNNCQQWQIVP